MDDEVDHPSSKAFGSGSSRRGKLTELRAALHSRNRKHRCHSIQDNFTIAVLQSALPTIILCYHLITIRLYFSF